MSFPVDLDERDRIPAGPKEIDFHTAHPLFLDVCPTDSFTDDGVYWVSQISGGAPIEYAGRVCRWSMPQPWLPAAPHSAAARRLLKGHLRMISHQSPNIPFSH
jgi:hypothetical protein